MSETDEQARVVTVAFDTAIYRLEAVKKAAYRFGSRCFVKLDVSGPAQVVVQLEQKPGGKENLVQVRGDFQTEVLDQELREVVAHETDAVRNLLLAQAFSRTALLDPIGETSDFREDPLGIRTPDRG
jgi:His-Xaa-Ser system protein HxsD